MSGSLAGGLLVASLLRMRSAMPPCSGRPERRCSAADALPAEQAAQRLAELRGRYRAKRNLIAG